MLETMAHVMRWMAVGTLTFFRNVLPVPILKLDVSVDCFLHQIFVILGTKWGVAA
jgi:hypothetical protein